MPFLIPTGLDRGNGVTEIPLQPQGSGGVGKFGTPDGTGSITVINPGGDPVTYNSDGTSNQVPQEDADSPEIERAEQATIMHKIKGGYYDMLVLLGGLGRGTFLEDSFGNVTRVLSSRLVSRKGRQSELSVTAESISFDTPPDEFSCTPVDLGIDIIKHPRYAWALNTNPSDETSNIPVGDITVNFVAIKSAIIRLIQTYRDSPFFPSADNINGLIQNNIMSSLSGSSTNTYLNVQVPVVGFDPTQAVSSPPLWDGVVANLPSGNYSYAIVAVPVNLSDPTDPIAIAIAASKEIISKLWRGEDVPYLPGYQVTLAQYFFKPVYLNPGAYSESPVGIVPDYFLSPTQDGSTTIFDQFAQINPQCFSSDGTATGAVSISWLRKSDEVDFQRSWFRYPSTWTGSPIGTFDVQIYSGGDRPQNANDFQQLI